LSAQRHPVVEFAKTRERGIAVNVLENEFTGMLAADTRDVYFYLGHVESHFRVFPKPVANLDEHLQGSFECVCLRAPWSFFLGGALQHFPPVIIGGDVYVSKPQDKGNIVLL
jgi:hypothetical protein